MEKSISYSKAIEELQSILEQLESEDVEIDTLSAKVKRSAELIKFCREKLKSTEIEIQKIMKGFEDEGDNPEK
ncbi:MAG: exodeoxyribonuclease VII small subunit [Elusimicrobia bacterium RIFOXYB2_FULL_48_7]|nr:MAG: exodeoxyribonuclease VII small subunit [Elusimicrobia bacterium RIFOXYB2_FULL_48_7]